MLKFPFFKKCNLSQLTLEVNWVCRPKVKTRNVKQQSERAVFFKFSSNNTLFGKPKNWMSCIFQNSTGVGL